MPDLLISLTLLTIAPLILLALLVLLKRLAISRGWIVRRSQSTDYELAMNRLRESMNETATEIGRALLPVVQKLATEMSALFPPLSRRQRVALWLDAHTPGWLNPWTYEYWLVMAGVFAAILLIGGIVVWSQA